MRLIEAATLDAVRRALADGAVVLGGGTRLLADGQSPPVLLDLRRLPGASDLSSGADGSLWVGSAVSLTRLERAVRSTFPAIAEAVRLMGSPVFRNLATVLGRLANREPVSDLYPPMRLAGARVLVIDPAGGPAWHPLSYQGRIYGPHRAWLALVIPPPSFLLMRFVKMARTRLNGAIVNGGVLIADDGVKAVLSGVGPEPWEGDCAGNPQTALANLAARWREYLTVDGPRIEDFRAAPAYREALGRVLWEQLAAAVPAPSKRQAKEA
ncbi:MAG: FAD binding domain-containing protein [Thermaerobacter sp.]|nr:FAD binding domain-containing protein [Thermaerobacter sp.]